MKTNIIIGLLASSLVMQAVSLLGTEAPVKPVDRLSNAKAWLDTNCPTLKRSVITPGGIRVSPREPMLCGHIVIAHPELVLD
jgi:hypothetical protein